MHNTYSHTRSHDGHIANGPDSGVGAARASESTNRAMDSAKQTVTICSRGRATSRLTQAPHSRAQTVSRTPPSRSAGWRLKDCNWRTSAIDSLLGCGRSEGCIEALPEARDPHQHHEIGRPTA